MMLKIKFKGRIYILTDGNLTDSPMATEYQYKNGLCSFAHLFSDGKIRRFNQAIGTKNDIEIIEKVEDVEPEEDAFSNLLSHPSWPIWR